MASISSLMSSSSSSVYSNPNAISGLASGMDTEAMIETAVSGIKTKLENLMKDRTKLEWEQSAFRSIIDKLSSFSDKYLSLGSNTNLLYSAFFTGSTTVTPMGAYKNMVSAVGKSSSDIQIKSATMATKANLYGPQVKNRKGEVATGETKISDVLPESFDFAQGGTFTINNKTIEVTADDTMKSIAGKISKATGLEASFSETSGALYVRTKTTGENAKITFGEGNEDLMNTLFGAAKTDPTGVATRNVSGANAKVTMEVNGIEVEKSYESNQFDVDGMTITLKGDITPAAGEAPVTFSTTTDTNKIINAVKSMIEDYNAIANEIKDAYATKPLTDSKGKRYQPLSEDDEKEMSESAIERYEKKAKTGLLFADSELSGLYDEMRSAITTLGFADIGITTVYENGKTTMKLDEDKMRTILESEPDKVREAFTKSTASSGADGGMTMLKKSLDKYSGSNGILVKLAGSTKSPLSINDNDYKRKLDDMDDVIKRWETKLTSKIDYYTKQFTRLEQMISNMNTQSSSLMGLMGY